MTPTAPAVIVMLVVLAPAGAFAHTVDAVGEYRLEIGWMNEPVITRETNGIEIFVSPLEPCPDMAPLYCAASQEFHDGIEGLEKSLKIQLIYKDEKITLPLTADHDTPGKYYTFVTPTVSGSYQANLLGDIQGTALSLSMHPPKVSERSYIEFPEPADLTVEQIIVGHTALIDEIGALKDEIKRVDQSALMGNIAAAAGLGAAGTAIALVAITRKRA